MLITAFDIIFFWVARMMMQGLHFMKDADGQPQVPFKDVYIHALVRDEKGQKMSKSKGNVIDPLELIDEYGADAVRFTLAAQAGQGRDIRMSKERVEGYRNFGTKLWNAARFAEMNECVVPAGFDPKTVTQTVNKWILSEAAQAVEAINAGLDGYRFNDAAAAAYRFVWNVFCDWHLNSPNRSSMARVRRPRPRPRRRPPSCSIRRSRCCTPSCPSSPKSCGARPARATAI